MIEFYHNVLIYGLRSRLKIISAVFLMRAHFFSAYSSVCLISFSSSMACEESVEGDIRKFDGKKTVRVLDAGTGFAQYSYFMAVLFPSSEILAVDIKEDYLATAKSFFSKVGLDQKTTLLTRT